MNKLNPTKLNISETLNHKPIKIGFVGAGPFIGTTELSSCFAIWLAENYFLNYNTPSVAYIQLAALENCNSNFFRQYSIDRFIDKYDFVDIFADSLISSNNKIDKVNNTSLGVNWLVPAYNFNSLLSDASHIPAQNKFNHKIYHISNDVLSHTDINLAVYNLGRSLNKEKFINEMNVIIAVSSSSRNHIEDSFEDINLIESFRGNGKPLMWIASDYASSIPKSFIREKLKGGNIQFLNNFDPEITMQCSYKRIFLCEEGKIKPDLWNFFNTAFRSFEKFIV